MYCACLYFHNICLHIGHLRCLHGTKPFVINFKKYNHVKFPTKEGNENKTNTQTHEQKEKTSKTFQFVQIGVRSEKKGTTTRKKELKT